jgi:SAM-dependent methyltransferase
MANAEEIAYWDGPAGSRWSQYQQRMDRAFESFDDAVLARAIARPGESVLDIGCGCGATALALARAVGATGHVEGVDVSHEMLALAQRRAAAAGLTNIRFTRSDASNDDLGVGAFDLLFSRFGVMFFDDPTAAFAHVRASLRSPGRLAFVCWRDLAANPWFSVPYFSVRDFAPPQPKMAAHAPGPMAFADADYLRTILETAGFANVAIEPFDANLTLGTRAEATEMLSQLGPAARMIELAPEDAKPAALASLERALGEHERDGSVRLTGGVWLVTGDSLR